MLELTAAIRRRRLPSGAPGIRVALHLVDGIDEGALLVPVDFRHG
jgi:hypothetical protein